MKTIIDRGYAVLVSRPDGLVDVAVSTSASKSHGSADVFALHSGVADVAVDPSIAMTSSANRRATEEIVTVVSEPDGRVYVRPVVPLHK